MRIPTLVLALAVLASLETGAAANTAYRRTPQVPDDTPAVVSFGHAHKLTIERADLALTTDGTTLHGLFRVVLSTWDDDRGDRSILLALPAGAEINQLFVRIGDERFEAISAAPNVARAAYEHVLEEQKDPALLEWVRSSPHRTWFRLRVFPVTPGRPATVDLGLILRRADNVAIDAGIYRIGSASITVDDREQHATKLEARLAVDVPSTPSVTSAPTKRAPFVNRKTSLVAGEDIGPEAPDPDPLLGQRVLGRGDVVTFY